MLKSQSRLLAKYSINERGKLINKTCLRYPFPHLHLSSRHGFRSYISSLSLLAVEYDLAVSSDSLLCRCSYYNNSVHELQVFENIYRGLKETTPCHPPSWLRLTAIISASGFSTSSKTSNHSASYVPATFRAISRKVARVVPLVLSVSKLALPRERCV